MNKNKHLLLSIIGIAILVIAVVGVTYAFFTYSKTGNENAIRTGDIYFNSTETGNTVTLSNVFPVASSTIGTANESETDVSTVAITIEGNTTYNGGVEYVLTLDDVNIETNTNPAKEIPLSLNVSVESITDQTTSTTTSIGTANNDYFTARGTTASPSSTAIYKITAKETAEQDEQILVGYVPKNVTVKGKVVVKAYIDDAKILITDTPDAVDTTGKTVISTTEWNSIKGNSALSFKVKVEARDGIWVKDSNINVLNTLYLGNISSNMSSIKEIHFNRMNSSAMQKAYDNATIKADLTYNNEGKVLAWLESNTIDNTKYNLIVASQGKTYLTNGSGLFPYVLSSLEKIVFNNVDTSRVTNMYNMFGGNSKLTELDLSSFDFTNVVDMSSMFKDCSGLQNITFGTQIITPNLRTMSNMFDGCSSLTSIDLSGFDTRALNSAQAVNMFNDCSSLEKIYVSPTKWDLSGQPSNMPIFGNNNRLVGQAPNTTYSFDSSEAKDKTYAVIATDNTKGYLTDVSLKPAS